MGLKSNTYYNLVKGKIRCDAQLPNIKINHLPDNINKI